MPWPNSRTQSVAWFTPAGLMYPLIDSSSWSRVWYCSRTISGTGSDQPCPETLSFERRILSVYSLFLFFNYSLIVPCFTCIIFALVGNFALIDFDFFVSLIWFSPLLATFFHFNWSYSFTKQSSVHLFIRRPWVRFTLCWSLFCDIFGFILIQTKDK